ncbi:hypothetical protein CK627_21130 [Aeromonas dhakensis]|nr:hypothetical protein CK627_21130 [Aeromonas dhakensis]
MTIFTIYPVIPSSNWLKVYCFFFHGENNFKLMPNNKCQVYYQLIICICTITETKIAILS